MPSNTYWKVKVKMHFIASGCQNSSTACFPAPSASATLFSMFLESDKGTLLAWLVCYHQRNRCPPGQRCGGGLVVGLVLVWDGGVMNVHSPSSLLSCSSSLSWTSHFSGRVFVRLVARWCARSSSSPRAMCTLLRSSRASFKFSVPSTAYWDLILEHSSSTIPFVLVRSWESVARSICCTYWNNFTSESLSHCPWKAPLAMLSLFAHNLFSFFCANSSSWLVIGVGRGWLSFGRKFTFWFQFWQSYILYILSCYPLRNIFLHQSLKKFTCHCFIPNVSFLAYWRPGLFQRFFFYVPCALGTYNAAFSCNESIFLQLEDCDNIMLLPWSIRCSTPCTCVMVLCIFDLKRPQAVLLLSRKMCYITRHKSDERSRFVLYKESRLWYLPSQCSHESYTVK